MTAIPYPTNYFDPFGDEKRCRICDGFLVQDPLTKEWYCPDDHEEKAAPAKKHADAKRRLEILAELGVTITPEMIAHEESLDADYLARKENTMLSDEGGK